MQELFHLSYEIPIKKWQALKLKNVSETKQNIQNRFKEEMTVLVDILKADLRTLMIGIDQEDFSQIPKLLLAIQELTGTYEKT